jgi:hypothetical protein
MNIKTIAMAILLGTITTLSSFAGADPEPILALRPYEHRQSNVLKINSLNHVVRYTQDKIEITSTWALKPQPELANLRRLIFSSSYSGGLQVKSVAIDGISLNWESLQGKAFSIARKKVGRAPKTIAVTYVLQNFKISGPTTINALEFFHLERLVHDSKGQLAYDLRPASSLDYSERVRTEALVEGAGEFILFGSGHVTRTGSKHVVASTTAGRFVIGFADRQLYAVNRFNVEQTEFSVIHRKNSSGFDPSRIQKIVSRSWPVYLNIFPKSTDAIVFYEDPSMPVGAGPAGTNVLGFGFQESTPPEIQDFLKTQAGWPAFSSSFGYISWVYKSSRDPVSDYWTTAVNHELGHLFFGFGDTTERHPYLYDYWFSLGMGILFDEQITAGMIGAPPALYENLVGYWKDHFSLNTNIDQRLVEPDISTDASQDVSSFNRLQHFGHAKAFYVLRKIREAIGADVFDRLAIDYVRHGGSSEGYLDFRKKLLLVYPGLPRLESELQIL